MTQLPLLDALATGQRLATLAEDRAEREAPGFAEQARAFVLAYLREHGATSGEELVDLMVAEGIAPDNHKAFGGTFLSLSRRGLIEKAGYGLRKKGHGTAGAVVWRIA